MVIHFHLIFNLTTRNYNKNLFTTTCQSLPFLYISITRLYRSDNGRMSHISCVFSVLTPLISLTCPLGEAAGFFNLSSLLDSLCSVADIPSIRFNHYDSLVTELVFFSISSSNLASNAAWILKFFRLSIKN